MAWDLELRLSGGASNTNPALSLGGAMSSQALGADAVAWSASGIAGISLVHGRGNPAGAGTLDFTFGATNHALTWKPAGHITSSDRAILVPNGGVAERYLLDTALYQGLVVDVAPALLPGASTSAGVTVTPAAGNLFDDVTALESRTGATDHRCVYLKNASATVTHALTLYIKSSPSGGDALAIGFDPAGVNGTAVTIAAESLDPAGVVFVQPTAISDATVLTATLTPGDSIALWLRRSVQPLSMTSLALDLSRLAIRSEAA